jgi:ABC-type sugar transport system ATPase subunit
VTLVLVTHDPNVAAIADERLVLRDGRPVIEEPVGRARPFDRLRPRASEGERPRESKVKFVL